MASWRDVKAGARRVVQNTMQIPLAYYAEGQLIPDSNSVSEPAVAPVVYGRLHLNDKALGDQAGTNLNSAEAVEPTPKIIFWRQALSDANITVERLDVFCAGADEAYEVDHVEPHDVETITVRVSRLRGTRGSSYAPPEVE